MSERRTCPICNYVIVNGKCSNRDYCSYVGKGWTSDDRLAAWAMVGVEERTVGGQAFPYREAEE